MDRDEECKSQMKTIRLKTGPADPEKIQSQMNGEMEQ